MAKRHAVMMMATFVSETKEKEYFDNIYPGQTEYIKRTIKGFLGFELTKVIGKERTYMSFSLWDSASAADEWVNDKVHQKLREIAIDSFVNYDLVTRWEESDKAGLEWSKCPICQTIGKPPKEICDCGFNLSHISLKAFNI